MPILYDIPAAGGGGGGGLPGVTVPLLTFRVGDPGAPVDGQTTFHYAMFEGQDLTNKQLLVIREAIPLMYTREIVRYNDGVLGGFTFIPASGIKFFAGELYNIFITQVNNTIE